MSAREVCRVEFVAGVPVRVRGVEPLDDAGRAALADVVAAVQARQRVVWLVPPRAPRGWTLAGLWRRAAMGLPCRSPRGGLRCWQCDPCKARWEATLP